MTRILLVNHAAAMGGAEMILLDVAAHLGPRCEAVLFADGPFRSQLEARGVRVHVLAAAAAMMGVTREASRARALAAAPAVVGMVRRLAGIARRFDLIYANSQKAAVVAMLAGLLGRKPVIWHMHDILSREHFGGLQRRFSVRLARVTRTRVIVISEAARAAFVASGGDPDRVVVVANGLDEALFDTPQAATSALRAGFGSGRTLLGLFGRLSPWKGQNVLLDAMAQLPELDALIVGDALFGEDAYRDGLRAQVRRLDLEDRVHFLGHRDDVPALMQAVDLVVHCSTSPEPFGRVIVESMLARRPIVASAHGASAELLGDAYPGLVEPGDPAALAAAITRMLTLPEAELMSLVDANEARARDRFTLPRMMRDIDAVLEKA